MENKEIKQLTHLMQTILDGQEKISEKLIQTGSSNKDEKEDNDENTIKFINRNLDTIYENQLKIFQKVSREKEPEKVIQNNDYSKEIKNQYFFFHPDMFQRIKKWMLVVGAILVLSPSGYFYYQQKKIEKTYESYKNFYEYVQKLETKKK